MTIERGWKGEAYLLEEPDLAWVVHGDRRSEGQQPWLVCLCPFLYPLDDCGRRREKEDDEKTRSRQRDTRSASDLRRHPCTRSRLTKLDLVDPLGFDLHDDMHAHARSPQSILPHLFLMFVHILGLHGMSVMLLFHLLLLTHLQQLHLLLLLLMETLVVLMMMVDRVDHALMLVELVRVGKLTRGERVTGFRSRLNDGGHCRRDTRV